MFEVSKRGRFNTLVRQDGTTISAALPGCTVVAPPHVAQTVDKTFMTVRLPQITVHDYALVRDVDAAIRRHAKDLDYSPLRGDTLVVKIPGKCLIDPNLRAGEIVDIDISLGNYGSFGYCWLANVVARPGIL